MFYNTTRKTAIFPKQMLHWRNVTFTHTFCISLARSLSASEQRPPGHLILFHSFCQNSNRKYFRVSSVSSLLLLLLSLPSSSLLLLVFYLLLPGTVCVDIVKFQWNFVCFCWFVFRADFGIKFWCVYICCVAFPNKILPHAVSLWHRNVENIFRASERASERIKCEEWKPRKCI